MVIDHISYAVLDFEGDHALIACFINSKVILGSDNIEVKQLQKF